MLKKINSQMPDLIAPEISQLLREFGDRMVLQGGNPEPGRTAFEFLRYFAWPIGR
jgi:hypothetical protein